MERTKGVVAHQLAQVDDLLARTRCFNCGELGHLAKDSPQNKELTTNSETFFSGMVCNDSCTVHPRNEFCADHSRDNYRAGISRNDSRARDSRDESRADDDSRNEPSAFVDSRNGLCVEGDFQRDDETFLGVRKDDVTFSMFKQMVSPFLFLVRAQASAQAQSLLLGHARNNVGTWNWNQVMELSTTCFSHL